MDAVKDARSLSFWTSRPGRLLLCLIAVLPFQSIYIHHYIARAGIPSGFIQWDLPYYNANGRAIFERGNGIAYPNPYDPSAQAPVIYYHWFVWVLGFGICNLGLDPGTWFVGLGVLASLLCAWATLRLVEVLLPLPAYKPLLFLLTMWGGGIMCLAQIIVNLFLRRPVDENLFAFDPFNGGWFLNWGRNLTIPTEAAYHAIVAASWLAVLTGHRFWAVLGGAAMAATHPFTGLELLLALLAWYSLRAFFQRDAVDALAALVLICVFVVFGWYYGVYLESFPEHRELRQVWSLDWTLSPQTMALAYWPVAILAVARMISGPERSGANVNFFVACFLVAFGLANHHWFISARQPLHFTHGYIWTPLWLIGMPWLQSMLIRLRQHASKVSFAFMASVLFLVGVSDNLAYLLDKWRTPTPGIYLTPTIRDMFAWVANHRLKGILLCRNPDLSYWSATYTALRPYYGHFYNTPHYQARLGETNAFFDGHGAGPWLGMVDYVLIGRNRAQRTLEQLKKHDNRPWRIVYQNDDYVLFGVAANSN
jgi:hypothetical protein